MATATTTAAATGAARVSPQGGILEGGNPTVYDSKNPLVLFIIQVMLVGSKMETVTKNNFRQSSLLCSVA
jgi:hypothetical protein